MRNHRAAQPYGIQDIRQVLCIGIDGLFASERATATVHKS